MKEKTILVFSSVLFLLSVLLLPLSECVDKSHYRTCSSNHFCKRNRALVGSERQEKHYIDALLNETAQSLTFRVLSDRSKKKWRLELSTYPQNVLRVRILNRKDNRYTDYVKEILSSAAVTSPIISDSKPQIGSHSFSISSAESTLTVVVNFNPIEIAMFSELGKVLVINSRQLFNFETKRSKDKDPVPQEIPKPDAQKPTEWDDEVDGKWEPPKIPNPNVEGRWEESFGSYSDPKPNGPTSVGLDVTFVGSKHLYGLPERSSSFRLQPTRGSGIDTDPYRLFNLDVFEYETNSHLPLYGSVPFVMSVSPRQSAGVLWLNPSDTYVDVSEEADGYSTHWFSEAGIIDAFFFVDQNPSKVTQQLGSVLGGASLPPLFSLGYHQCKWNYRDEKQVEEIHQGFDTHNIPVDVLWLDIEHTDQKKYFTWDPHHFPNPLVMQEKLKSTGRKLVTIIDPHIKEDHNYIVYRLAQDSSLFVKNPDGTSYAGDCWPGRSSWIDYLDPEARKWWSDRYAYSFYNGSTDILFVWNDMNEPSIFDGPEKTFPKHLQHYKNVEHREIHNIYGYLMQKATYEGLASRDPGKRPFVLSRSFFAGAQRYGAIWTGDNGATWEFLKTGQRMLLSLHISGIVFSGADIGGFFGDPDAELLTRWYQHALFSPFFRSHAHIDAKRREPWLFGEPYLTHIRDAIRLRYSLLPYLYLLMFRNHQVAAPVIKPLWFDFPQQTQFYDMEDEFMLGSSLLVKPIMDPGVKETDVTFPTGTIWYNIFTGEKYTQPQVKFDVNLSTILAFQRGGSIIPRQMRPRRSSGSMVNDPYTLFIAVDRDLKAEGEVYIDDFTTTAATTDAVYQQRKLQFIRNRLISESVHNKYSIENHYERIVLMGLGRSPKSIEFSGKSLEFKYEPQKDLLLVHNVDVKVASDFMIKFNF